MFHFWFPGQHYIRLQTAGSTALNHNKLSKADAQKNRASFKESAGLGRAAGDPAKPAGPLGGAGRVEPPFPAPLGASASLTHLQCSHGAETRQLGRARLHKRAKDCRETGTKLTASGNTKDCMRGTAATTYHMAGKLRRGQGPSPPPSSSPLTNVATNLWRCSQIQERSIPSATSSVSLSLENFSYSGTSKGHALHHLMCKIKAKSLASRNK